VFSTAPDRARPPASAVKRRVDVAQGGRPACARTLGGSTLTVGNVARLRSVTRRRR